MKNFMIYLFSRQGRLNLAYVLIALNIIQVLAGCLLTGGSIYICLSVTKHLYAEKAEIRFVFTVFALFGTHIIIHYLLGIKIVEICFVKAHKRSTKRNLYFWLFASSNTILDLLVLASMIVKISKHIIRSIRHSMEKGMRHYLTDPVWKHTMDRWQFSLKCCGVNHYKDWYMVSWLDKYHINVDSPTVHSLLLSKDHLHLPVTPWSCCDIDFPMQCFHDPIQQMDSAHIWKEQPDVPEMSLNKQGCLDVIRYPIEMALVIFLILCIILIVIQVIIIIVSRFLYTSCRNAVILRDCYGVAPGWLFSRDCLAERRGRSISEILLDLQHQSDSEEDEEDFDYDFDEADDKSPLYITTNLRDKNLKPDEPNLKDTQRSSKIKRPSKLEEEETKEIPPRVPKHSDNHLRETIEVHRLAKIEENIVSKDTNLQRKEENVTRATSVEKQPRFSVRETIGVNTATIPQFSFGTDMQGLPTQESRRILHSGSRQRSDEHWKPSEDHRKLLHGRRKQIHDPGHNFNEKHNLHEDMQMINEVPTLSGHSYNVRDYRGSMPSQRHSTQAQTSSRHSHSWRRQGSVIKSKRSSQVRNPHKAAQHCSSSTSTTFTPETFNVDPTMPSQDYYDSLPYQSDVYSYDVTQQPTMDYGPNEQTWVNMSEETYTMPTSRDSERDPVSVCTEEALMLR